jgi:large subunit ribosomal protein L25
MSVLQVERRVAGATKPKHLRKQGLLPLAFVTKDNQTATMQVSAENLRKAMSHIDALGRLDIEIAGEKGKRKVMVKQVDKDYLKGQILHVVLQEVSDDDTVKIDIPVVPIGTPQPVEDGIGVLVHPTDHIKIRGRMGDLPNHFEVDVSKLEMTGHINASDVVLPEGIELISSPDATLFSLSAIQVEEPAESVAMGEEAPGEMEGDGGEGTDEKETGGEVS